MTNSKLQIKSKIQISKSKTNYEKLKSFALEQGAAVFGVCDISDFKKDFYLSQDVMKDLNFAISLGFRLSGKILDEIIDAPTKLYFHHYRSVNNFLDQLALKVCDLIQKQDFKALPIPASQIIDWQRQKGHLSHKKIARAAGLGWIGRNNLLVNPGYGAQMRLVTVLTNMPLKTDKPARRNCGECRICLTVCPAGAIKENKENFQHLICFEKLKEFQKARLVDQYICGICVKACKGTDPS